MSRYNNIGITGLYCFCVIVPLQTQDTLTLINHLSQPIYVAYYTPSGKRGDQSITLVPAKRNETPGITTMNTPVQKIFIPTASYVLGAKHLDDLKGTISLSKDAISSAEKSPEEEQPKTIIFDSLGTEVGATVKERSHPISLINTTQKTVYCALYYTNGIAARRWSNVITLAPGARHTIVRPERKCKKATLAVCTAYYDRNIYLSESAEELTEQISHKALPFFNVGSMKGSVFYIFEEKGKLHGSMELSWQVQSAQATLRELLKQDAQKVKQRYEQLSYQGKGEIATVRQGSELSAAEQNFLRLRHNNYVKPACQKFFAHICSAANKTPTIGICASGGGCRAMLTLSGFLAEVERRNFLPLVSYIATLSGSTWHTCAWLASKLTAIEYNNQLIKQLHPSIAQRVTLIQLQEALLKKDAFKERTSIIDIYGNVLANTLLKPYAPNHNPNALFWGEALQPRVDTAEVPFPLCTAATPRQFSDLDLSKSHPSDYYLWVTFDPYEVSVDAHKKSIPAWSFGRIFKNDQAIAGIPPQNIGFCMGIFGSAMSINMADAIRVGLGTASPSMSQKLLDLITQHESINLLTQQRASPAKIPNFIQNGMITLVDAGVSLIMPFPPLTKQERKVDIIIAVDASAVLKGAPGLLHVENYYKKLNLPFPKIDKKELTKPYAIFWDKQSPQAPIVIYLPLVGGPEYHNNWKPDDHFWTQSTNFGFSEKQAALLSGCGAYLFARAYDDIMSTISEWLAAHA